MQIVLVFVLADHLDEGIGAALYGVLHNTAAPGFKIQAAFGEEKDGGKAAERNEHYATQPSFEYYVAGMARHMVRRTRW